MAAYRLITNSNLVDWKVSKSAGLVPLRIRPALGLTMPATLLATADGMIE